MFDETGPGERLTERVSVDSAGRETPFASNEQPAISGDGRYVAFVTAAALAPRDSGPPMRDVYVHDRVTGTTELVSVGTALLPGTLPSAVPSISADGRYVVFSSRATDFVPLGAPPVRPHIYVRDRQRGTTERADVNAAKAAGNENPGGREFLGAAISGDGSYVALDSPSTNLLPGDENRTGDIFIAMNCDAAGVCGNGVVDPGCEQCDDGNTAGGDGCSASCELECAPAPVMGCRTAGKTLLRLKRKAPDPSKDRLRWKWANGQATSTGEFGDPRVDTGYALCLYAGAAPSPVAKAAVGPSDLGWRVTGVTGYKYTDKNAIVSGVRRILLKASALDKAKALLIGTGETLPDLPLPLALPVIAQLINGTNSVCWETTFGAATVVRNDGEVFKARTP
jgi:cysteine-rich repeat protein